VTERRSRRSDPARRDRIIDAALEVIARDGVAGTTHRRVAAQADVPLGSMTYHFAGLDELILEALTRFAERASESFRAAFSGVRTEAGARDAVLALITDDPDPRDLVVTHEVYTLAARRPEFRRVTRDWMARDRALFEEHFDPRTARVLNALIEGLVLHRVLDTQHHDPEVARTAVDGALRDASSSVEGR